MKTEPEAGERFTAWITKYALTSRARLAKRADWYRAHPWVSPVLLFTWRK